MQAKRFVNLLTGLFLVVFLTMTISGLAQPDSGPGGGGDPGEDPPVPITGIEYLVGAGTLLGIRYLRKRNKDKSI